MDNSSLFGELLESGKTAVKNVGKTAAQLPGDLASTAAEQISGKSGGSNQQNQAFQQQINQMKQQDAQDSEAQIAAIRKNLAQIMTPPVKPKDELPKYISGKPGAAKTISELEELNKKAEEKRKKEEKMTRGVTLKNRGSSEANRGMMG